jgi:fermentation-respiration switch protein FrsA (DUF1100 family)
MDYRGYGGNRGAPTERGLAADSRAARAYLIARPDVDPQRLVYFGESLGAAVAIDLASRHPELGGLIVESGFTSIYDMAELEPKYNIYPLRLLINQRFESIAKVPHLALPVLYIHGTADEIVPYSMGVALYERSGGRKRLLPVPGGDHEHNAVIARTALARAISELTATPPAAVLAENQPAR